MQNRFAEIKLRAERKAGELGAASEKNKGSKGVGMQLHDETTLALVVSGLSQGLPSGALA